MIQGIRRDAYRATRYVPGKTTDAVIRDYGIRRVVKLGSNENNYAPFPGVLRVMEQELRRANVYPEKNYVRLQELLGDKLGLSRRWIGLGHGAGNVLDTIAKTFLEDGDEVIIPQPSYGLYKDISWVMGAKVVFTGIHADFTLDVDAIAAAVTPRTKLIWLCNPNNPTGTVADRKKLEQLICGLSPATWVVMDEAYREFADPALMPDTIRYVRGGFNVLCVRTFSKYYGLAGQRIGYVAANPEFISFYDTVSEPFNANRAGLAGAVELLETNCAEADKYLALMLADRERVAAAVRALGCTPVKSHSNFLFIGLPFPAAHVNELLLRRGVITRPCDGWGYPDHLRVSIGTTAENDVFLQALGEALAELREGGKACGY